MTKTVNVAQLKANLSRYLREVLTGTRANLDVNAASEFRPRWVNPWNSGLTMPFKRVRRQSAR